MHHEAVYGWLWQRGSVHSMLNALTFRASVATEDCTATTEYDLKLTLTTGPLQQGIILSSP